jgi:hypothetical protein
MKLARVGVIAAAVLAVATLAWAQKTDFSGTWALDAEASGAPAGGAPAGGAPGGGGGGGGRGGGRGGGLGQGGTVKQTATELTVERTMGENKVTSTYKLDGTESKNSMMGRGGAPVEAVSVAKWEGPALVIVTKMDMGNGPQESTQKWTLAGTALTIETTNARGTQKMVYKKQ